MDSLTIAAASGLRARMQSLDLLANNLANSATSGYKADQECYGLYAGADSSAALDGAGGPSNTGTLPVVERTWTDFSQGMLQTTGNALDLALSGKGFFAVAGPNGTMYTRGGNFQVDAQGHLVTSEGYSLLAEGGTPLQVDPNKPVEVSADGSVHQGSTLLGQLQIAELPDPSALAKVGRNYFRLRDANAKPAQATQVQVHQGKLEGSNVSAAESAVRLVAVMRQFEMLQRAIGMSAEMNKKAVEEVARVGS